MAFKQTSFGLTLILMLFTELHSYGGDVSSAELPIGKILSISKKKCLKNFKGKSSSQVQIALMELEICLIEYDFPTLDAADLKLSAVLSDTCVNLRNYGYDCIKSFTDTVQPCLDPEEKYLPDFLLTSYNDTFNIMCEDERLLNLISRNETASCSAVLNDMQYDFFNTCLSELKLIKDLYHSDYLTIAKKYLCRDIQTAFECAMDRVRKHCGNGTDYTEAIDVFFNVYLNQCKGVLENDS